MPDEVADPQPQDPASDPVADDPQPSTPDTPAELEQPAAPEWRNWLYTGPPHRTYADIPVTVTSGAIVRWHSIPATDGHWTETDADANTTTDNYRPDPGDLYLQAEAAKAADESKEG